MGSSLFRRALVFGIIILFVGVATVSSMGVYVKTTHKEVKERSILLKDNGDDEPFIAAAETFDSGTLTSSI